MAKKLHTAGQWNSFMSYEILLHELTNTYSFPRGFQCNIFSDNITQGGANNAMLSGNFLVLCDVIMTSG